MPERFTMDMLLRALEPIIDQLPDHHTGRNTTYTISDAVRSAFAVFFMQSPSFLLTLILLAFLCDIVLDLQHIQYRQLRRALATQRTFFDVLRALNLLQLFEA